MLPLAVLLFVVPIEATALEGSTFDYEDPTNGEAVKCKLCPPGTYMGAPCTVTQDTVCLPCSKDHFTQFYNYLPYCLYCSNFCKENQIVKEECSATSNRVCECENGYHWREYFCEKHTRCRSGFGAKRVGDAQTDTQCEKCPRGTFSAQMSSSEQCKNHTDCRQLLLALPGKTWHDNVCVSCADLQNGGHVDILRGILPGFFTYKNITPSKLRRLVKLINGKQDHLPPFDHKPVVLRYIFKWTDKATRDQLKDLPGMLERSGLNNAARNIKRIIDRLEKASKCLK